MADRKRFVAVILVLALAAALTGCGMSASAPFGSKPAAEKYSKYIFDAFDTVITVTAYCESQAEFDALMQTAEEEFMRCHRLFDIYFTYPELNNLKTVNDNAGIQPVKVSAEIMDLLSFAKEMYELTDGCVNVAMGSVLKIWHDTREYALAFPDDTRLPDMDELRAAAKHTSIDDIVLDEENGTVFLRDSEMRLDVGAVAKGYAAEKVAAALKALGYNSFAINAGGNVRIGGAKPDGSSWIVGITNPDLTDSATSLGSVKSAGGSVVTSGTYQRFFEYEGRRYHHIIDGKSLLPEERYVSLTVLTENSAYADALSTALFNMEPDAGYAFVASLDGVEAMWVDCDGEIRLTEGFPLSY